MSALPIVDVLQKDTIDRTAADVIAANPVGTFVGGVSSVPVHLYQSLPTIWGVAASAFSSQVVADLGTGATTPKGSIVVSSRTVREQSYDYQSLRSDTPGAEIAYTSILLYKPRINVSTDVIQNASLRIRYLLDNTLRGSRGLAGNIPDLSVRRDITLDSRHHMYCFYIENAEPILASEAVLSFITDYVRLFTR